MRTWPNLQQKPQSTVDFQFNNVPFNNNFFNLVFSWVTKISLHNILLNWKFLRELAIQLNNIFQNFPGLEKIIKM